MTTLYLIRHGEAEGNIYRRSQGHYNSDLTGLGRRQVAALGERFRDVPLDAVYSSDLYRAMETAAAICRVKGLPLRTDRRLREVDTGVWEDQPFGNIRAEDPAQFRAFITYDPDWHVSGSDTVETLSRRGEAALRDIAARHPGGTVAVCAHGMLLRATICRLTCGLDRVDLVPQGENTAVFRLREDGGVFSLEDVNDTGHLDASLRNPRGLGDLALRPMEETAVEEYIRYRKDAWQVVYGNLKGFDGPGFWLDARRSVGPDPAAMVVGYLDDRPVGMIQLNPSRDMRKGVGYIPFLYLREPYRHRGLGIQLIGHAVSFYRRLGRTKLQLSVYPKNEKALGFYHKYGFTQVKKQRGLFGSLLLMEKDIALPTAPAGVEIISMDRE